MLRRALSSAAFLATSAAAAAAVFVFLSALVEPAVTERLDAVGMEPIAFEHSSAGRTSQEAVEAKMYGPGAVKISSKVRGSLPTNDHSPR